MAKILMVGYIKPYTYWVNHLMIGWWLTDSFLGSSRKIGEDEPILTSIFFKIGEDESILSHIFQRAG